MSEAGHESVLLDEILTLLRPGEGEVFVDCTLGRGGHALAIAQRLGPTGLLLGLDVDEANLAYARERLAAPKADSTAVPVPPRPPYSALLPRPRYSGGEGRGEGAPGIPASPASAQNPSPQPSPLSTGERETRGSSAPASAAPCQVRLFQANFAQLDEVLDHCGAGFQPPPFAVDAILADLGVSTNQLFDPSYGLSFSADMPLDMRLDKRDPSTAADLVNRMAEEDLANVLYNLAQERYSRRIARKIGEARRVSPITTTGRLADIVRAAIPRRGGAPERIDPATRTFLALRMLVNREVENLRALLEAAPRRLKPGGRMAVISFQSVEDRLVKQAFRSAEQAGLVTILTKRPVSPSESEVSANPRSRSAKLRVIERRQ